VINLATEREHLLRRDAEWAEVALEGHDIERILSYWTDDAVVLAPGLPRVSGKAALREYVQGSNAIPGFAITWESKDAVLSPDGQLAYLFSRKCGYAERRRWNTDDDVRTGGNDLAARVDGECAAPSIFGMLNRLNPGLTTCRVRRISLIGPRPI
jgi:hypothetical protein